MSQLKYSLTCIDCGIEHGRRKPAALCLPCLDLREWKRRRTPKYRAYCHKYNNSPKGKLKKGEWYDLNRDRHLLSARESYLRRRKPAKPRQCQTEGCTNTIPPLAGSHALFCVECAHAFYGPAYAKSRKAA